MIDRDQLETIIDRHGAAREQLIATLLDCQEAFCYLPREVIETVAARVGVPVSTVLGVATFFRAFSLKPVGQYPVQVCMGTACHVQGAPRLLDALMRELKIGKGDTTDDLVFSLTTVNCLGCCGLAPVVTMGGDVHGKVRQAGVPRLLKKYRDRKVASH